MVPPHIQALIIREILCALRLRAEEERLLGLAYGHQHKVLASLLRRSGTIIQFVIREILRDAPHLAVLNLGKIPVSEEADRVAANADVATALATHLAYDPYAERLVQPDFLVLRLNDVRGHRPRAGHLDIVECKRGGGRLCSTALFALRRNILALQMQSLSFAAHLGLGVTSTRAMAISLYGESGSDSAFTITGEELDAYFDYDVSRRLDAALEFFRDELHRRLPPPSGFLDQWPRPDDPEGPLPGGSNPDDGGSGPGESA